VTRDPFLDGRRDRRGCAGVLLALAVGAAAELVGLVLVVIVRLRGDR